MSMRQLGKHGIPKGTVTNPARRAILGHLRDHGASTPAPLIEALLQADVVTADDLARDRNWLHHHLSRLCAQGLVIRRKNDADDYVWAAVAEPAEDEPAKSVLLAGVAAPRHIDRMLGPVYQPPCPTPARAGALDFAQAPSVIGSRRVPFRSAA